VLSQTRKACWTITKADVLDYHLVMTGRQPQRRPPVPGADGRARAVSTSNRADRKPEPASTWLVECFGIYRPTEVHRNPTLKPQPKITNTQPSAGNLEPGS
jgi:hypothetical protein